MSNVTREELAEVLGNLASIIASMPAGNGGEAAAVRGALVVEMQRLAPPKVRDVWPENGSGWIRNGKLTSVEVYPAGVVGPVVEALRKHHSAFTCSCPCPEEPQASRDALAAFDRACRGEKP